ncbi:lactonase family protein [Serratia ureilytica]|uniref:lactonase family protein n=1 Tax=Serratia TaxID=613 RepID=UPI00164EBD23|nr:lactonase family protein [Serratia ureilytica]QNK99816.1 lactonase family protein [Serratia ureilytica]
MKNATFPSIAKFSFLSLLLPAWITQAAPPQPQPGSTAQIVLIGTWTGERDGDRVQPPVYPSQGMYRLALNEDGSLLPLNRIKMDSPSWIVLSKNRQFAYTTNETQQGQISTLRLGKGGDPQRISGIDSQGQEPTHTAISPDGRYLLAANYSNAPGHASVIVAPILQNGELGEVLQRFPFTKGSEAVAERQASAHIHSVNFTPDGRMMYAADLGGDIIHAFFYDAANKAAPFRLAPDYDLSFPPGTGPRHMIFSANGRFAYVISEMSANIFAYQINNDRLENIQTLALTESARADAKGGGGLAFSPDGKYLYASNRQKTNEIVGYKINPENGKLTLIGRTLSGGIEPRAFAFDKSGKFLLVANVFSNNVTVLQRDLDTGELYGNGVSVQIGTPTDVKFIHE